MFSIRKAMCVVAHADDELGAAGTLLRIGSDAEVALVVASTPFLDAKGKPVPGAELRRQDELVRVAEALMVDSMLLLGWDERDILWTMDRTMEIDRIVQQFEPDLIITNRTPDTHVGHEMMAKIVRSVCRKNRIGVWEMSQVLPGGIEPDAPSPNLYVNVTAVYDHKLAAIRAYESQVEKYPEWVEANVARDKYNGWLLRQDGLGDVEYAETFRIVKMPWL